MVRWLDLLNLVLELGPKVEVEVKRKERMSLDTDT